MKPRMLVLLIFVIGLLLFLYQKRQRLEFDQQRQTISMAGYQFSSQPQQSEIPRPSFSFKGYTVRPLADFLIRARVLSRENYSVDAGSKLSPMDLALGWQRMADPAIYGALHITQGSRWYRYSLHGQPPIPPQEIVESSANMHLIPADESVANVLDQAEPGRFVRIKGKLVEVTGEKGWLWRSSLSRTDSGAGSCELIFVEAAVVE